MVDRFLACQSDGDVNRGSKVPIPFESMNFYTTRDLQGRMGQVRYINFVKFRKKAPGLIFFKGPSQGAYFRRGLCTEGILRFQIYWVSLIVGSKFTVFTLFYCVFEGNFPSTSARGAYIWMGDLTEGFLRNHFGALIYTWRSLFSEFTGMLSWIRHFRTKIAIF